MTIKLPEKMAVSEADVALFLAQAQEGEASGYARAWVAADKHIITATVPAGEYVMSVQFFSGEYPIAEYTLTDTGWVVDPDDGGVAAKSVVVEEGETAEMTAQELEAQ